MPRVILPTDPDYIPQIETLTGWPQPEDYLSPAKQAAITSQLDEDPEGLVNGVTEIPPDDWVKTPALGGDLIRTVEQLFTQAREVVQPFTPEPFIESASPAGTIKLYLTSIKRLAILLRPGATDLPLLAHSVACAQAAHVEELCLLLLA